MWQDAALACGIETFCLVPGDLLEHCAQRFCAGVFRVGVGPEAAPRAYFVTPLRRLRSDALESGSRSRAELAKKLLKGTHIAIRCREHIEHDALNDARVELNQLQAELDELDGMVLDMADALGRDALRRSERRLRTLLQFGEISDETDT